MSGTSARICLTETMFHILTKLSKSRSLPRSVATRASVILLGFLNFTNQEIAEEVDLGRKQVGLWRRRWRDSYEALLQIQFQESAACFRRTLIAVLSDAPRSGCPPKFTAEQVVEILSVACEPPADSGRPVTDWTARELADEARKRNIVDSISESQVHRYLRQAELQPHRNKYWCFTTEKDEELYRRQIGEVCQTYLQAVARYEDEHTRTVCVDEMTSLGANERRAPEKLPAPGQIGKREGQYTRHGTLCLTGSWDVSLGQIVQTTIEETRNAVDFANHIRRTVETDTLAQWIFVVDNLNTHCGEPLVRTVAQWLGIDEDALGAVKKSGVLHNMESRKAFLCDVSHPIRFVYLPKHSSWLNQIEVIFGIVKRRVIRHGSFRSQEDLKEKLLAFIEYYNQTFAVPMNWTYTGKPLRTNKPPRPKTWREKRQTRANEPKSVLVG